MELHLDDPLLVAPVYWQQFVLHQDAATSITNLYTETCTMLRARLLQAAAAIKGVIGRDGTLELWLDMFLRLFAALDTRHALPGPWEDTMPDLQGTQLQIV